MMNKQGIVTEKEMRENNGFQLLCPRKKWHTATRPLQINDIVLVKYQQSLGKDKYRLARVNEVYPDQHGKIRTVGVVTRDQRKAVRERRHNGKFI